MQKTLRASLRRCRYRHWLATLKGHSVETVTKETERLYRGNTPYVVGKTRVQTWTYVNVEIAQRRMIKMADRRKKSGYAKVRPPIID